MSDDEAREAQIETTISVFDALVQRAETQRHRFGSADKNYDLYLGFIYAVQIELGIMEELGMPAPPSRR